MRKADIDVDLVSRLVAAQFPQWAHLPVTPVEHDGWDNSTFRLGDELSVRLPSHDRYVRQVDKEHRWLPVLAPQLPLPIPRPEAKGAPGCGFPRPWSVYRWLPGSHAAIDRIADLEAFATTLGLFLTALEAVDATGGPQPQPYGDRGGPLVWWEDGMRPAIETIRAHAEAGIDADAVTDAWEASLAAPRWDRQPVWAHGDTSASNLLVTDGRLSGVIDFGSSGVGDPACDLGVAWTFFHGPSREAFRRALALDDATWLRGRGWALWKAVVVLAQALVDGPEASAASGLQFGWRVNASAVIHDVLADAAGR